MDCQNLSDLREALTSFAHEDWDQFHSVKERLDTSVVLAMCKFGCDELYENGYIVVSNSGVIQANEKPSTDPVNARVSALEGRKIAGFSNANNPILSGIDSITKSHRID